MSDTIDKVCAFCFITLSILVIMLIICVPIGAYLNYKKCGTLSCESNIIKLDADIKHRQGIIVGE